MEPRSSSSHTQNDVPRPTWIALTKYLIGEADSGERDIVEQWEAASPYRKAVLPKLRMGWRQGVARPELDNTAAAEIKVAFAEVQRKIDPSWRQDDRSNSVPDNMTYRMIPKYSGQHQGAGPQIFRSARQKDGVFFGRTLRRGMWYVLAAIVAIVAIWQPKAHHLPGWTPAILTYTTGSGERANVTLPDGGTVALNVASRLDVPADYSTGNHTLQLSGEAIFTVPHHEETPFTVVAGGTPTRVLGTRFAVRHYATDTTTTIEVQEGKVSVGTLFVSAAQVAKVNRSGVAHLGVTDGSMFSFAAGVLTLPHMTLLQAIPELDRWYAVNIRLGDSSLARVPIQGNFVAGSWSDLARNLELGLDARVVRDGQLLTLYSKAKQ